MIQSSFRRKCNTSRSIWTRLCWELKIGLVLRWEEYGGNEYYLVCLVFDRSLVSIFKILVLLKSESRNCWFRMRYLILFTFIKITLSYELRPTFSPIKTRFSLKIYSPSVFAYILNRKKTSRLLWYPFEYRSNFLLPFLLCPFYSLSLQNYFEKYSVFH